MTPIHADGATNETTALSENDAADAFFARIHPTEDDASKKKLSDQGETEDEADEAHESDTDEQEQESDASDESPDADEESDGSDEAKEKKYVDSDETYVKLKVGDEELEVPVKDLKRLYGQEAALTRKSQEVAAQRAQVEEEGQKHSAALNVMLTRASEKADQYRNLDWIAITKNPDISAEEASALRTEAQKAFEEENFLKAELGNYVKHVAEKTTAAIRTQAKECIKLLSTQGTDDKPNPHFIEGWSEKLYDDLRSFGVSMGLHKDMVNNLVDPAAFKMMHMAMQFHRGAKKVTVEKVNKAPKKIVKTSSAPAANRIPASASKDKAAMAKLRSNGNQENAANAFLARITADSDE